MTRGSEGDECVVLESSAVLDSQRGDWYSKVGDVFQGKVLSELVSNASSAATCIIHAHGGTQLLLQSSSRGFRAAGTHEKARNRLHISYCRTSSMLVVLTVWIGVSVLSLWLVVCGES